MKKAKNKSKKTLQFIKGFRPFIDFKDEFSQRKLTSALNTMMKTINVNTEFDVPYLAGYSEDGDTIYIDKKAPKYLIYKNKKVNVFRYYVLHEIVEKALIEYVGIIDYELAHQIALRAEKAAVVGENVSWKIYYAFAQQCIYALRFESEFLIPPDLDLKPYFDKNDIYILERIRKK